MEESRILEKYDLLISSDESADLDVVKIGRKFDIKREVVDGRKVDVIEVPEDLKVYDVLPSPPAQESFQPISFIIATQAKPLSDAGRRLKERMQREVDKGEVVDLYHYVAWCFIEGDEKKCPKFIVEKSYRRRKEEGHGKSNVPIIRAVCDLVPKAKYIEKHGEFPPRTVLEETGFKPYCSEARKYFGKPDYEVLDRLAEAARKEINPERVERGAEVFKKFYKPRA